VGYLLRLTAQKQAAKTKDGLKDETRYNVAAHIKNYTITGLSCNSFFRIFLLFPEWEIFLLIHQSFYPLAIRGFEE
jgi:hypothetical protein